MANLFNKISFVLLIIIALLTIVIAWFVIKNDMDKVDEVHILNKTELIKEMHTYKDSFIGLSEQQATKKARIDGLVPRVVEREDEKFAVTSDFRTDRINFVIRNGQVSRVEFY